MITDLRKKNVTDIQNIKLWAIAIDITSSYIFETNYAYIAYPMDDLSPKQKANMVDYLFWNIEYVDIQIANELPKLSAHDVITLLDPPKRVMKND